MKTEATFTCKLCKKRIIVKANSIFGLIKNSYKISKAHEKECKLHLK